MDCHEQFSVGTYPSKFDVHPIWLIQRFTKAGQNLILSMRNKATNFFVIKVSFLLKSTF